MITNTELRGVPHPLRDPCPACGCVDGTRKLVGGQETVRRSGCGRWAFNCPKVDLDPSHKKPMFIMWDKPKTISGVYEGSEERPSRLFPIPRRVHRPRNTEGVFLFSGTIAINTKLSDSVIDRWVEITYKGETLTAIGNRFKRFAITIKTKRRNEI